MNTLGPLHGQTQRPIATLALPPFPTCRRHDVEEYCVLDKEARPLKAAAPAAVPGDVPLFQRGRQRLGPIRLDLSRGCNGDL